MAEKKTASKSKSKKSTTKKKTTKKTSSKSAAAKKSSTSAKKSTAAKKTPSKKASAKKTTENKETALTNFIDFVREQGVVGLAVAFILGLAANTAVQSLVEGVVNPLVGMFFDAGNLSELTYISPDTSFTNPAEFQYGLVLSAVLNLLIIAGVVYFVVKGLGFEKLDKKKDDK